MRHRHKTFRFRHPLTIAKRTNPTNYSVSIPLFVLSEQRATFQKVDSYCLYLLIRDGNNAILILAQNPILCEGIRRQRSDLTLNLLTLYKDDQARLTQILDK